MKEKFLKAFNKLSLKELYELSQRIADGLFIGSKENIDLMLEAIDEILDKKEEIAEQSGKNPKLTSFININRPFSQLSSRELESLTTLQLIKWANGIKQKARKALSRLEILEYEDLMFESNSIMKYLRERERVAVQNRPKAVQNEKDNIKPKINTSKSLTSKKPTAVVDYQSLSRIDLRNTKNILEAQIIKSEMFGWYSKLASQKKELAKINEILSNDDTKTSQ